MDGNKMPKTVLRDTNSFNQIDPGSDFLSAPILSARANIYMHMIKPYYFE